MAHDGPTRRPASACPRLTDRMILAWCDFHCKRTGDWPTRASGSIRDAAGETWGAVDDALKRGARGCPGGSSLAKLLAARRGRPHLRLQSWITIAQVLKWADAHHRRIGQWPVHATGPVHGVPGEHWAALDDALRHGRRGLPGGLSLPKLLSIYRDRPYPGRGGSQVPQFPVSAVNGQPGLYHMRMRPVS